MSDFLIQPASIPNYQNLPKTIVAHFVVLELSKKVSFFIATKFDASQHGAKFIGFFTDANEADIAESYDEIIRTTDAKNYVDIFFPWHKIQSVRSLIYRHKQIGEKK